MRWSWPQRGMRSCDRISAAMPRRRDARAIMPMPPVFRFAPSPNGHLHLGHALSALLNFDMARAAGGRFLLRIEDIDATRCRPEFEAAIYEDLAWLGIAWEEPVRRQSEHFDDYRAALGKLEAHGPRSIRASRAAPRSRAWWPTATSHERWPRDPDGAPLYPGAARQHDATRSARGAHRARRALCAPPRHERARSSGPARCTGARPARARPARPATIGADPAGLGRRHARRARRRRPAITSRSWSTTRCRA